MPTSRQPNVLFILTDDQQFDTIRALGNEQIHTPNLDKLVAEGMTFSRAYIMGGDQPAVCCPSRAMIHTGRSLYRTGCNSRGEIPAEVPTLAETFRKAGYRTFTTGKQHNGSGMMARGFSDVEKIMFGGMGHHMRLSVHDFDPSGRYDDTNAKTVPQYSSEMFTEAALNFLSKDRGDAPFFMYVAYTVPHDPIMAPPEYASLYDPETFRLHPTFQPSHPVERNKDGECYRPMQSCPECTSDAVLKYHKWPIDEADMRYLMAGYYAMITHLDNQLGRIRAKLEASGEWENTVIVFAGDNGIAMGRHGCYHKQTSHDHDAHVPLILSGPGVPKGQITGAMVYLYDLFPTLCDLTGLKAPQGVEGQSLVPILEGKNKIGREVLYHAYMENWRAVYDGRYRYIIYAGYDTTGSTLVQKHFLYDIQEDPFEANDLSDHPTYVEEQVRLKDLLYKLRDAYSEPIVAGGFWERYEQTRAK
ncbi:MAG: sulfatase-like hydrolase/transferase [Trueperaceae bacterium]